MKIWIKATAMILFTFILGFVLGWYSSGKYHDHKRKVSLEEMRSMRRTARFAMPQRLEHLINPTKDQRDTVRAILNMYHEKLIARSVKDFEFIRSIVDSLILDLEPVLNEEQLDKLKDRRQLFRPGFEEGPPFDGPFHGRPFRRPPPGLLKRNGITPEPTPRLPDQER